MSAADDRINGHTLTYSRMVNAVTYRLDLGSMDRDAFAWDAASQTLDVVLPPLRMRPLLMLLIMARAMPPKSMPK